MRLPTKTVRWINMHNSLRHRGFVCARQLEKYCEFNIDTGNRSHFICTFTWTDIIFWKIRKKNIGRRQQEIIQKRKWSIELSVVNSSQQQQNRCTQSVQSSLLWVTLETDANCKVLITRKGKSDGQAGVNILNRRECVITATKKHEDEQQNQSSKEQVVQYDDESHQALQKHVS